jgi:hypothetical protein
MPLHLAATGWLRLSKRSPLHDTRSPDMISPFGSRGADRSAKLSAGTETPLLRPLKLQQPNHQNASEYDVSCLSLTHMSVGGIGVKHVAESSLPGCRARKRMRGHTEREDQLGSEGCIFGREAKGARKFQRVSRAERPSESLYKLLHPARESRSKNHSPLMPYSVSAWLL